MPCVWVEIAQNSLFGLPLHHNVEVMPARKTDVASIRGSGYFGQYLLNGIRFRFIGAHIKPLLRIVALWVTKSLNFF